MASTREQVPRQSFSGPFFLLREIKSIKSEIELTLFLITRGVPSNIPVWNKNLISLFSSDLHDPKRMLYLMDNARYNFTTSCVYHALYE